MDRNVWIVLSVAALASARQLPRPRRRFEFSDCLIVRMWLWAALHDRPMSWACERAHYSSLFRPRRLPSVSQFNKRINSFRFLRLRVLLHRRLTRAGNADLVRFLDGMAMPLREHTRDTDATSGPAGSKIRRGYKLHACGTSRGFVPEYRVRPMNHAEPSTARLIIKQVREGTLVLADAAYDSFRLYRAIGERGGQLLTRLRGELAWSEPLIRKITPARRRAVRAWQTDPQACEKVLEARDGIERIFAHLTTPGGGMHGLPPWIRGRRRVRLWVDAKIAIYHARLLIRRGLVAA